MAATLSVTCPNCRKQLKVPAEFAGKLIKCKNCQTPFEVADPNAPKPARAAKPAAPAKPPAAAKAANPPDDVLGFMEEPKPARQEEENANPYGVIKESDAPRCPFCAQELDPPDTKICMKCGYDLLERRRHESRKVYETSGGDYFMHWLPAIVLILFVIILTAVNVICWMNMYSWLEGSFLESDEKNPTTLEKEYYIKPWCFSLWISIFSAFTIFYSVRFIIRRLVFNWRPEEIVKRT
jgi:hypothetical protein